MDVTTAHCIYYPPHFFCGVIFHVENVFCGIRTMNLLETCVVGLLGEVYNYVSLTSLTNLF